MKPRHLPRQRRQVMQGMGVDHALEIDHMFQRIPKINPAPVVELRGIGQIQLQMMLFSSELEQKPDLFLADTDQPVVAAHRPWR